METNLWLLALLGLWGLLMTGIDLMQILDGWRGRLADRRARREIVVRTDQRPAPRPRRRWGLRVRQGVWCLYWVMFLATAPLIVVPTAVIMRLLWPATMRRFGFRLVGPKQTVGFFLRVVWEMYMSWCGPWPALAEGSSDGSLTP